MTWRLKVREVKKPGRRLYVVDMRRRGGGGRRYFRSRQTAHAFAAAYVSVEQRIRAEWDTITPAELLDTMEAFAYARACGKRLTDLVGRPVTETPFVPCSVAMEEFLRSKQAAGRRPIYVRGLQSCLQRFFRGMIERQVSSLSLTEIETILSQFTPSNRRTYLIRLSSFFSFCVRRSWVSENPCERIERVKLDRGRPTVLSATACARALVWTLACEPRRTAWLSLALFAGVRPHELDRIGWSDVDLDHNHVTLDAAATKVRQRRIVVLSPTATAWLRIGREVHAPLPVPVNRRCYLVRLHRATRSRSWGPDVLRHTAASMTLANSRDIAQVAHNLGTSPQVLHHHYLELVRPAEAQRFCQLIPNLDRPWVQRLLAHAKSTIRRQGLSRRVVSTGS